MTKPTKHKYKYTKKLVKTALNDGMTQKEIATLCRTQQSKVSGWASGEKVAYEHEINPLKARYGHIVERQSFKLYTGRNDDGTVKYIKVAGKVIFSYNLRKAYHFTISHQKSRAVNYIVENIFIHALKHGKFLIIHTHRPHNEKIMLETDSKTWPLYIIKKVNSVNEALEHIGTFSEKSGDGLLSYELPISVRKAFLDHGYQLDDIEIIE